jgi:hypothetical protein
MHATCGSQSEVWKLNRAVEFISVIEASKLVTIEVESQSHTPSLWLKHHRRWCTHYILTTFYHMHCYSLQLLGIYDQVFHNNKYIMSLWEIAARCTQFTSPVATCTCIRFRWCMVYIYFIYSGASSPFSSIMRLYPHETIATSIVDCMTYWIPS